MLKQSQEQELDDQILDLWSQVGFSNYPDPFDPWNLLLLVPC
jgi:hypothetical protein